MQYQLCLLIQDRKDVGEPSASKFDWMEMFGL